MSGAPVQVRRGGLQVPLLLLQARGHEGKKWVVECFNKDPFWNTCALFCPPVVKRVDASTYLEQHLPSEEGEVGITEDPHTHTDVFSDYLWYFI